MYANNMSVEDAIKLGKSRRDVIDPIGKFPKLLNALRNGLNEEGLLDQIRLSVDIQEDILEI